jgi:hypothetical protein
MAVSVADLPHDSNIGKVLLFVTKFAKARFHLQASASSEIFPGYTPDPH